LVTFDENDSAKLSLADAGRRCRAGRRKHVVLAESDVPPGQGRRGWQSV
jgi:hypothetical protein